MAKLDPGFAEFEAEAFVSAVEEVVEQHEAPPLNVHQRLAKAMEAVTYVQKEEKKKDMMYRVVSHDAVTAKVRPALLNAGIVYYPQNLKHTQNGNRTEVTLDIRFVNVDDPQDYFDVPSLGYGVSTSDKGPGAAISYSVKYALLKALGLETGDDDPDLHQKTEHVPEAPQLAPDGTPVPALDYALVACADSIAAIKAGIDAGDYSSAHEAWSELTRGEQMALWKAPSKRGPFTTAQRKIMQTPEFRNANGEDHA